MKKFMAYLMDNDTVAYGLGDVEFGDTKEEATQKLKAVWLAGISEEDMDGRSDDQAWAEFVEDGEGREAWSVEKMRLFVKEVTV